MAVRRLIDTNVYSALKRGRREVVELIRESSQLLLSAVVVGELMSGFRTGSRQSENLHDFKEFIASPYVEFLPITMTTAERFGRVSAALRTAGTPIPTNDVWIAAHALETGAELISYDQHFSLVGGLAWIDPVARQV